MIKPSKLNKGDKVAIVSLSSGILGEEFCKHQVELGTKRLIEMGLEPIFMPNSLKGIEFIKNNPKARAQDLKDAFNNPSIKAIICAIGGDDTYTTIPFLLDDIDFINSVKNNPKIFVGFSDTTNNHFMFNKIGLVTYYGVNFLSDVAELGDKMFDYTLLNYNRLFRNDKEFEIESSPTWYENRIDYSIKSLGTNCIEHLETKGFEVLNGKGKVKGIFFGGCLESIFDMYTSQRYIDQKDIFIKYELLPTINELKDKILFLETSEEKANPNEFRKMIEVLINNQILQSIKALIFGKPYDEVYYNEYKEILIELTKPFELPILYNVNVGHALPRTLIPYGVMGEVDFDNIKLKVIEEMFSSK